MHKIFNVHGSHRNLHILILILIFFFFFKVKDICFPFSKEHGFRDGVATLKTDLMECYAGFGRLAEHC